VLLVRYFCSRGVAAAWRTTAGFPLARDSPVDQRAVDRRVSLRAFYTTLAVLPSGRGVLLPLEARRLLSQL
jgi:hypothetical protein